MTQTRLSRSLAARVYSRLLNLGFRLLYNEMAWTYDMVSWIVSAGEWRAWQRAALRYLDALPGTLILELAHGTANLQRDLRSAGYDTIGLDLSRAMGRIAHRKLRHAKPIPKLVGGDARRLPFHAGQFAVIVCTFPTDFIVDPLVIGEIYRVLQPGGRLVFVSSATFTGHGAIKTILESAYHLTGQRDSWPSDILRRFETAGFTLTTHAEPCTISVAQVLVAHK